MRIGAVFPQLEIGADPAVFRAWTETVEEVGYTHVLAYDHVLGADPANRPGWTGVGFIEGWRELGATHLCVNTMNMGLSKPADHAAVLRDVLPLLRGSSTEEKE